MSILDDLNPQQRLAATTLEGPVLIFAGAGSGKTRALTYRIAYMVREAGIPPQGILAVTFTNKAAEEMKERIAALVGEEARRIWAGTFHAICARLLRQDGQQIGVPPNFVVFDEGDQVALVRQALSAANYDPEQYKPADVLTAIGRAKDELLTPDDYRRTRKGPFEEVVAAVYARYQQALEANRALDFDDLIMKTAQLLASCPEVLEKWQERLRYILVDEYQDINYAQYRFLNLLAAKYRNICVVGDDDQSIYGWRGANVHLILHFHEDYPEAKIIYLEQNYRSSRRIVACASAIIGHNPTRAPKTLWTANPDGELPVVYEAINETEEAEWVTGEIQRLRAAGIRYGDLAVLYRTNAMSRHFEEAFMRAGIPYQIVGGLRFYERAEVKDLLAYLRLLHNPADDVAAWRALARPPRGIGAKTVALLKQEMARRGLSVLEACARLAEEEALRPQTREALRAFLELLEQLRAQAAELSLADLAAAVVEQTGYLDWLRASARADQQMRADNVEEFVTLAQEYQQRVPQADLASFLEHVALMSDVDEAGELGNGVALMTLHAAKGLEFAVVFIVGLEEGTFPHERSMSSPEELEEERRLCYVGITRAKERLYLTYCRYRTIYGQRERRVPSRFLRELPPEGVRFVRTGLFTPEAAAWEGVGRAAERELESPRGHLDLVAVIDGGRRAASQPEGLPAPVSAAAGCEASSLVALRPGDKLSHPTFGPGTVVSVDGEGAKAQITVAFERAGLRKLAAAYVRAEWVQ
jgi:DNA helicase-2/ATP-dependent DNA helicase PcrA